MAEDTPKHYLTIERLEDGSLEWEIEHDPSCPTEPWINDLDGNEIRNHTCDVGNEITHAGLDGLPDWEKLPDGRHEIGFWWSKSPAGPWGGEEWDAGLELVGAQPELV